MAEICVQASDVRQLFSQCLNRVAFGSDRIVVVRHKRELAALIPFAQFEALRRLELKEPEPEEQLYQRAIERYRAEVHRIHAEKADAGAG